MNTENRFLKLEALDWWHKVASCFRRDAEAFSINGTRNVEFERLPNREIVTWVLCPFFKTHPVRFCDFGEVSEAFSEAGSLFFVGDEGRTIDNFAISFSRIIMCNNFKRELDWKPVLCAFSESQAAYCRVVSCLDPYHGFELYRELVPFPDLPACFISPSLLDRYELTNHIGSTDQENGSFNIKILSKHTKYNHDDIATLDQIAGIVHRTKRCLEHYKKKGKLPSPVIEGGGGQPAYYHWRTMRPWLESTFHIKLPDRFPDNLRG